MMASPPVPAYGWNPYAGRVFHRLTGERHPGTRRPVTVCGAPLGRNGGAGDAAPTGYVECKVCRRRAL
jgi:hypothetical protein